MDIVFLINRHVLPARRLGCPGVFQALPFTFGRHSVQAEGSQPPKRDSAAVLWTVFLRHCVSALPFLPTSQSRKYSV